MKKNLLVFQVRTINVSELSYFVPKDTLPVNLGGRQVPCHKVWLQFCYLSATNQQPDPGSYFTACSSRSGLRQLSLTHSSSADTDTFLSDFDSESSKDTVSEKHINEDREKEKEDTDEMSEKEDGKQVQGVVNRKRKTSESRKHGSNSSGVNEFVTDEMPRKRRPLSSGSNILDDSIHMPDSTGVTIQELLAKVNTLKRRGLFAEYATIKMEPPAGTFTISK